MCKKKAFQPPLRDSVMEADGSPVSDALLTVPHIAISILFRRDCLDTTKECSEFHTGI